MYFKDLLRYRQVWLGLAMLWIILFHLPVDVGLLEYPKAIGYGGVDICFFASGIGCFYSLSAESDVGSFMKRRLKRLVPTYVVFVVFWLIYQYITGNFNLQMALGNLLALQTFTGLGQEFNWYISAIFLFYILAPYFMAIVKRASAVSNILFLLFLLVCSVPFWGADAYIVAVTRLPVFFAGMVFADMCRKDKRMTTGFGIGMIAIFLLGVAVLLVSNDVAPEYLWSYGLHWYPFILITPPLCIAISYISMGLEKIKATKLLLSFFSLCGSYSFELYLVHILLVSCISDCIRIFDLSHVSYLVWAAGGVLLAAGCYLLRHFTMLINGLFYKNQ